jgi:hypothetical protein
MAAEQSVSQSNSVYAPYSACVPRSKGCDNIDHVALFQRPAFYTGHYLQLDPRVERTEPEGEWRWSRLRSGLQPLDAALEGAKAHLVS